MSKGISMVHLFRTVLFVILAALGVQACGGQQERFQYVEEPVEVLYNRGVENLELNRYPTAIRFFDEVERQHPYSVWARRAMLMSAYANYEADEYEASVEAAERFLALHPGNKDAAYAYYLIAICHYERILDVQRDQEMTNKALDALQEVTRRYPSSSYARDARLKLDLVNDHLAGRELDIGRWYMRRGDLIAAINRFQTVVDRYDTTSHVPEALHRMAEAYMMLGLPQEAKKVASVLGYNYPGGRWYEDSYKLVENPDYRPRNPGGEDEDGNLLASVFGLFR
jgi:outer membrane protein assembly factor BamD